MHVDPVLIPLLFYILPAIVAACRDCDNFRWIFVVNVAFGWTIVGWFVALIWAICGEKR